MSHPPAQESSGLDSSLAAICAVGLQQELIEGWANDIKAYTCKARQLATSHIETKSAVVSVESQLEERLWQVHSKLEADYKAGISIDSEEYFFSGAIVSPRDAFRSVSIARLHIRDPFHRRPWRCSSSTCNSSPKHFHLNHTSDPGR